MAHDTAVRAMGKNAIGVLSTLKNCNPVNIVAGSRSCPERPYVMKVTMAGQLSFHLSISSCGSFWSSLSTVVEFERSVRRKKRGWSLTHGPPREWV